MRHFEVESCIQDSIRIVQMATEVHEVHEGVQGVQRGVDTILENLDLVSKSPNPSAAIPSKPALFYGRDKEVEHIAYRIVTTRPSRFGITGSGGIGKTSLVSAVIKHPRVTHNFNSRIHWSRCDEATSPPLLIEVISRSFHLDQSSKDRLRDIKSFLHSETQPRLLVLDNFETPWDVEGRQSDITDIICALAEFPHLSILLTMRGTLPGVGRVRWSKPELPPLTVLPAKASRELYVDIDPSAGSDKALEALLSELDHMPLAVTLMAKAGSEGGGTPTQLLKRWKSRGTEVIHDEGGDRLTSVNLSIQLSLRSNLMKKNPDALRVLSVLAMLPDGIKNDAIHDLVPDVSDPAKARSVLLRTSLVYARIDTNSFQVLSPIRSYIAHYHPPTPELRRGLHKFCFDYIQQHDPNTLNRKSFVTALATKEVNLEAILSDALHHEPSSAAITSALGFINYQTMTYARTGPHIAMLAVAAANRVGTEYQIAACLERLGNIHYVQGRYNDAGGALDEARRIFLRLGDANSAAVCLWYLGGVARSQARYNDARGILERCRGEFMRLGNLTSSSSCTEALALVAYYQGRYKDAQSGFEEIFQMRRQAGQGTGSALSGLGMVAQMEGRYEDAKNAFMQYRVEAVQSGDLSGGASGLLLLGTVYDMEERYGSARAAFLEAQEVFIQHRDPNAITECLKRLGNVDWKEGRIDEGRRKLGQALGKFRELGQDDDVAECMQNLGDANAADGRYELGRNQAHDALRRFRHLKLPKGVPDSLTVLGYISMKEGRLLEARWNLEAAYNSYEEMGAKDWWQVRCSTLLGDLSSATI
ncbi:hypothetical protein FRB93_011410 [Tulasnella sp. JGI-2019a]|nr:hypothetical protein FRB93_011410 [Tulasnella sp. JGI-2019a]